MKKLLIILVCALVAFASCTKSKEVHPEIGDGNDEIITVGMKDVHVKYTRTDHAELSRVVFHYSIAEVQQFEAAEMTKQETFFELALNDLLSDTLYEYYYELFYNSGETSITEQKTFHTQAYDTPTPPSGVPEGAINGLFSVSPTQKVYISQGNLQYQASTNTWRFAEHQWDYVGDGTYGTVYENGVKCDNGLISPTYDGWIDLFGWGTSGYNHGAVCYQPFSSIEDNTKYWIYGSDTMNLYDSSGQADWGYNRISNGGNREGLWRTLKGNSDELYYLLMSRNTSSGIRFAPACVNGVKGIILFPDNWDAGIYHITNANANNSILFADNTVSLEEWNALLEPNGCVFLPVSGKRAYYGIVNLGEDYSYVDYWTSSISVHNQDEYDISVLGFSDDGIYLCDGTHTQRCYGSAVRLVQDAQ